MSWPMFILYPGYLTHNSHQPETWATTSLTTCLHFLDLIFEQWIEKMIGQLKFFVSIVLVLSYKTTWTKAFQNLKGIKCSGKNEELQIQSYNSKFGDLCPELDIKLR